jgi:hypothetical protein
LVTVTTSLITGNHAGAHGGGIYSSGTTWLANVTIAQNTASRSGGGLASVGGALEGYNLTVAGNTANYYGGTDGTGGGIYISSGTGRLSNSVLAANMRVILNILTPDDCSGSFSAFHYSLVQSTNGCTFANDNTLTGVDALLLPLAANGGPTRTQALGPGSPALDAAYPGGCESPFGSLLLTDQRGYGRHADGNDDGAARCDMGAFEAQLLLFVPLLFR